MKKTNQVRVEFKVPFDFLAKLEHFSKQENLSRSDFILEACESYINQIVTDFDIPTASVQRINQLVEGMISMENRMESLEKTVDTGLRSFIELSRGNNYLLEEGE